MLDPRSPPGVLVWPEDGDCVPDVYYRETSHNCAPCGHRYDCRRYWAAQTPAKLSRFLSGYHLSAKGLTTRYTTRRNTFRNTCGGGRAKTRPTLRPSRGLRPHFEKMAIFGCEEPGRSNNRTSAECRSAGVPSSTSSHNCVHCMVTTVFHLPVSSPPAPSGGRIAASPHAGAHPFFSARRGSRCRGDV